MAKDGRSLHKEKPIRKAVSPVIALALLTVVVVASVIGFSNWYQTFGSDIGERTEQESNLGVEGKLRIEKIGGTTLFVLNNDIQNITISQVSVHGSDCGVSTSATPGINELDVSSCVASGITEQEVVVVTTEEIVTKKVFVGS